MIVVATSVETVVQMFLQMVRCQLSLVFRPFLQEGGEKGLVHIVSAHASDFHGIHETVNLSVNLHSTKHNGGQVAMEPPLSEASCLLLLPT